MSASDFNSFLSASDAASTLHFQAGYQASYDSNSSSDTITVTLIQLATADDAAAFASGFSVGEPVKSAADPVIPGAQDFDTTTANSGTYDHGAIGTKGSRAFVVEYMNGTAGSVPAVGPLAHSQYERL
jgi:hypothetical protein